MRVIVFLGRSHHVSRLQPVANELVQRGHDVIPVTCNNGPNFDAHTENLKDIPYVHASDYLPKVNTSDAILKHIWGYDFVGVSDLRMYISPYWIAQGVVEFNNLIGAWNNMLDDIRPDVTIGLHVNNAFFRALAYCSQEKNIPTVGFAEGRLRHADQSTMGKQSLAGDYLTKLFVWSDEMKQTYINSGVDESKLEVVGIVHLDEWIRKNSPETRLSIRQSLGIRNDWPLVTFALPVLNRYEGNASLAIETVINWAAWKKVNLIIKFHPFESIQNVNSVRDGVEKNGIENVLVMSEGESAPVLMASNLVISQHSTAGPEAIAFSVPFAEYDGDNVGVLESLADEGVAFSIGKGEIGKLDKILSGELMLESSVVEKWRIENLGALDGFATERTILAVEKLFLTTRTNTYIEKTT